MKQLTKSTLANFEGISHIVNEKSNFTYAFRLLPLKQRVAMHNIYALCSYLDDIIDTDENTNVYVKRARLDYWRQQINNIYSNKLKCYDTTSLQPLQDTINDFNIPQKYFNELLEGLGMDLDYKCYDTIDSLLSYCYGVAGVVGLITLCILTNNRNDKIKEYGINLGNALQITNIIRDVYFDSLRGYCYVPAELLQKYSYSFEDIKMKLYDDNFIAMMQELSDKALLYYAKAETNYNTMLSFNPLLKNELKLAQLLRNTYFTLLKKIKRKKINVFNGKISLNSIDKLISIMYINF